MPIVHCGRDISVAKSYVDLTPRFLSAVSPNASISSCGGANTDFIKALDKSASRKAGVQYLFTLNRGQRERLLHKPSLSVKVKIDTFSMLRALLLRLSGLLDERWMQSTHYFRRESMVNNVLLFPWIHNSSMLFNALQALANGKLDISNVFLVVQNMITHWPQIVAYISSTKKRQELKHVKYDYVSGISSVFAW